MLAGVLIGSVSICLGVVFILLRWPFFRLVLRGMKRFYGQPVADMYEHVGVKGVVVGGGAFIAAGLAQLVVTILVGF